MDEPQNASAQQIASAQVGEHNGEHAAITLDPDHPGDHTPVEVRVAGGNELIDGVAEDEPSNDVHPQPEVLQDEMNPFEALGYEYTLASEPDVHMGSPRPEIYGLELSPEVIGRYSADIPHDERVGFNQRGISGDGAIAAANADVDGDFVSAANDAAAEQGNEDDGSEKADNEGDPEAIGANAIRINVQQV